MTILVVVLFKRPENRSMSCVQALLTASITIERHI